MLQATCPVEGCGYVAFGDDRREVLKDLYWHMTEMHGKDRVPEERLVIREPSLVRRGQSIYRDSMMGIP